MTKGITLLIAAALTAPLCSCSHTNQKGDETSPLTKGRDQAAQSVGRSAQSFEKAKTDYLNKAQDDIDALADRISSFKTSSPADSESRRGHNATVRTLEEDLANARAKLSSLRNATDAQWHDRQRQVEQAVLTARAATDAATQVAH
jgi:chromosome segregation ATPase